MNKKIHPVFWNTNATSTAQTINPAFLPEPIWHTKDGRGIPFDLVSQQHWSNIYWYHLYILQNKDNRYAVKCRQFMNTAIENLEKRFKGELLDWKPLYEDEKEWYRSQCVRKVLVEKIGFKTQNKKVFFKV